MTKGIFEAEYKKLNRAQKEAVDTIQGPVMVVAGPGTGKTQILALRIANILKQTDIKGDGILCLTFTNSAVGAMRDRLVRYIGEEGDKVNIFTFHSFGMLVIEKYFKELGLSEAPRLLKEGDLAVIFDEILNTHEWQYLRPRGDSARYFNDLKSLMSLLKRERISADDFGQDVNKYIDSLKNSDESISTRGASKGELKKEVEKEIESLQKSLEIVEFIKIYEKTKREKNVLDYDDVLEGLVRIIESSEEALADIREKYLYVLVDEHQDSSRVQNEFLSKVWGAIEQPDIFVVGDDRQLIYGFSGASIDHFKGFRKSFHNAKLIPLIENYRSTQVILDAAHALLRSVMSDDKLVSQSDEHHPIRLVEVNTKEDEILSVAVDIKEKVKNGLNPSTCAILVPKNKQAREAIEILHKEGVPVALSESLNLFDLKETRALVRILKIIDSKDTTSLALSFFDECSGVLPLEAHEFFASQKMREFSFDSLLDKPTSLFGGNGVDKWIAKLSGWLKDNESGDLKNLIRTIGGEFLEKDSKQKKIVTGEEVARNLISLVEEKPYMSLHQFVVHLEHIMTYNEAVPFVTESTEGVRVLTMHSSKGLEFDYVWIAHMDQRSLSSGKKIGFALPESILEKIEERDIDSIKRKLYVAITRAKKFCTLSYAVASKKGTDQDLAKIIAELPEEVFQREKVSVKKSEESNVSDLPSLTKSVAEKYTERYVSASMLNNFFECPWKWYFRNLLGLPESKSEILEFGSTVHASLERVLKLVDTPSVELIEQISSEEVSNTNFGSEQARVRMIREVKEILSKWVKTRLPEIKLNRKTEESVSVQDVDFPDLKIYGKIDLIENLSGREVRVTDFKTGSGRRKSEIEKLDDEGRMSSNLRQLAMYSYLLANNKKWIADVRESRLEFLEAKNSKDSIYDRVITSEELELLKRDIADYSALVSSGEWVERPCHYNSYGKNTECEYCKLSSVFK